MDNAIFTKTEDRMKKALDALKHELSILRTGRATLAILDGIKAEYYGTLTPLNQMATLSVPDPRTIAIQPWDASALSAIEKAIQKSGIGLNPINDGKIIRLPIPPLNEERRRELAKSVKHHGEECKVSLRNTRRDVNDELKALKKDSKITEDEEKKGFDRVQKMTDDYTKKIDEMLAHKEKDIMEV